MTLFRLIKERIGDHPNIVALREVYFDAPPFYVEEEHVAGQDLGTWCESQGGVGKVPLGVRLEIVAQVADALQAAHDAGVIHRDVKPGNILVSGQWSVISDRRSEVRGQRSEVSETTAELRSPISGLRSPMVKLTDFGIGQVVSAEVLAGVTKAGFTQTMLGSTSSQTGTQRYMAPELLSGKPASTRSDIYSLGAVFYQLLVGDFTQTVTIDWARRISDPLLREDLEHCLSGEPQDRFAGAAQLAQSLRCYGQREAELTERERLAAQALRRRRLARAAIAVTGVLLLVSLGLAYGLNKARRGRDWAQLQAYVADMKIADVAIQAGNLGQAMALLRRHIPERGGRDWRGIEWRYLWQRCQGEQVATFLHPTEVNGVDISPDGRWVATQCQGKFLLWDREHPDQRRRLAFGASAGAGQFVAFSPVGRLLATASQDEITVWDTSSWERVRALPVQGAVLAFSGDGATLAAFGNGGVQTWRTTTWQEQVRVGELNVPQDGGRAVALNYDGTLLVACVDSGMNYTETRKDDLAAWRLPQRSLVFRDSEAVVGPRALAVSPDGHWLAVGSRTGTVHLWDLKANRKGVAWDAHEGLVQGVTFTRDSQTLVSAGSDQSLRFWVPGQAQSSTSLHGHSGEILSLRASADGRWLVSASKDGTARLWHASGQAERVPACPIPRNRLIHPLSPDGRRMFTTNPADWSFEEWDTTSGQRVRRVPIQATHLLWGLAEKVGAGKIGEFMQRNSFVFDWVALRAAPEKGEPGRVCALEVRDPPWALYASTVDGTVLAWDRETGALVYSNRLGLGPIIAGKSTTHQQHIVGIEKLPGGWQWRGFTWDLKQNRRQAYLTDFRFQSALGTTIAPDGSLIVYPSPAGWFMVWDRAKGLSQSGIRVPMSWQSVALSPDKRLLAVTSGDAVAQVWSLRSSKPVTGPLVGHLAGINKLGFSADSRTLITYSEDRTARLWNVATGREVMSGLPLNWFLFWKPAIHLLSRDNNAVIEPEGEDKLRVVPLPTLAAIDAAEAGLRAKTIAETVARVQGIQDWLVLGPIAFGAAQSGSAALDEQQIPDESQLRPRAGDRVRQGGQELTWRAVHLQGSPVLDFGSGERCVAYAACYLWADAAKRGVILHVGSDDQAKVYLNGQEIYRSLASRSLVPDQDRRENLELRAGLNVLVFKVVNETLHWQGAIRLTDTNENALPGVKATLQPER
jgi:WD40 repeat protein